VSGWLTTLVTIASLLFGGGGLAVLVNAITGRKGRKAEVADRLSDSSLKWVQEFQEETQHQRAEAAEARREAAEARREVAQVRLELANVRREAEALVADLRNLRGLAPPPEVRPVLTAPVGPATDTPPERVAGRAVDRVDQLDLRLPARPAVTLRQLRPLHHSTIGGARCMCSKTGSASPAHRS
jgi:transposase-like protein